MSRIYGGEDKSLLAPGHYMEDKTIWFQLR